MKFAYAIVYVADVSDTLAFYQRAFGFALRFLHHSGQYGELDTGATTLAFASHALGDSILAQRATRSSTRPARRQPLSWHLSATMSPPPILRPWPPVPARWPNPRSSPGGRWWRMCGRQKAR